MTVIEELRELVEGPVIPPGRPHPEAKKLAAQVQAGTLSKDQARTFLMKTTKTAQDLDATMKAIDAELKKQIMTVKK